MIKKIIYIFIVFIFVGCGGDSGDDNNVNNGTNYIPSENEKNTNTNTTVNTIQEEPKELTQLEKELNSCYGEQCYNLAMSKYYLVKSEEQNHKAFIALIEKACNENSVSGCYGLGDYYYNNSNRTKSYTYLDKAYSLGNQTLKNAMVTLFPIWSEQRN